MDGPKVFMKILMIILTVFTPLLIAVSAINNEQMWVAVGILIQMIWSTMLLVHILSDEGIFSFD